MVVEYDAADSVANGEDTKGGKRGRLRRCHRFHVEARAEEHGHALVDQEQGGPVALLGVDADMRLALAGGHLPVDRTHVVARQVAANFFEVEATPTHPRGVASVEHTLRRLARQKGQGARLALEPAQMRQSRINPWVDQFFWKSGRHAPILRQGDDLHDLVDNRVGSGPLALRLVR